MIHCKIVTPIGVYKELDTSILNVVSTDGELGILPKHMPLVTMLQISKLSTMEDNKPVKYAIGGGLLYFQDDVATILVDSIESEDEINAKRAQEAYDRAFRRIKAKDENIDVKRAEVALKKAMNRLSVKGVDYRQK